MEESVLLENATMIWLELHMLCLALVIILFVNMRRSSVRGGRRTSRALTKVYIGIMLTIASDCVWTIMSDTGSPNQAAAYCINLIYFLSSSAAAAFWLVFCVKQLRTKSSQTAWALVLSLTPYAVIAGLYVLSPVFGFIFTIQNGIYVRGSLFFLDPIIKIGYISAASVLSVIYGRKEQLEYRRKNRFSYAAFGLPVLVCGVLHLLTGADFNCLGATLGLIWIYLVGITNSDSENTDAIYSLANSFEASYVVNMDTGLMRPLHKDEMHDTNTPGMESKDFTTRFHTVLAPILLPEDRISTLEAFQMENVAKRFRIDRAFSIRYRVREGAGQTVIHTASFIHAPGEQGKQEFLLGINTLQTDSLLYERNEALLHENRRLEQVNTSIIESVAKIVEARDSGTGDHVTRVKKITEVLAKEIMVSNPEYHLDEERVKMISAASVLHDVGKIVIPDAILLKPGRLTDEEYRIMKTHSAKGCDILNVFPLGLDDAFLECALSICRWHHEKYDGKGYPDGLAGDDIPISAQIVSLADCFDALISERPYKKAIPPETAFAMIAGGQCGSFSPAVLHAMENQRSRLLELARLYR